MVTYENNEDRIWKAIADNTRRLILDLLTDGPKTTGQLVESIDTIGRTAVLKHLNILQQVDLIQVRRNGRSRWNYMNPLPLECICKPWITQHIQQMSTSMNQLKSLAENDDNQQERK